MSDIRYVNKMGRQGDVLVMRVDGMPKGDFKEVKIDPIKDKGMVVLAYGEVTGHSHALNPKTGVKMFSNGSERFLQIPEPSALKHEEHAPFTIEAGTYKVIQQFEYTPFGERSVAD